MLRNAMFIVVNPNIGSIDLATSKRKLVFLEQISRMLSATLSLSGRISAVFSWYLYFSLENKPSVSDHTRKIPLA